MNQAALDIFRAALGAVDPYNAVREHTSRIRTLYAAREYHQLYVVAIGKAAFSMARAIVDDLGDVVTKGVILTKYGHAGDEGLPPTFEIFEAGHPVPDEQGFAATRKIIDFVKCACDKTLVLCLISGGGSALGVAPAEPVTLAEKQALTRLLLKAGANIVELNSVRKHLSCFKGGRLAEMAAPATVISLILSDVIGDPLDVIASGPTSPDAATYHDAMAVIDKYGLRDKIPGSVLQVLNDGVCGLLADTPKDDHPQFGKTENLIIGSIGKAIEAARAKAKELGCNTLVLGADIQGEAREVGYMLARQAIEAARYRSDSPLCLIAGGETTVTVTGDGLGGRNTEMALAFAKAIAGRSGITFLSAGTDGTDGPTDAAGAVVDGETIPRAGTMGLDPDEYLENNDSYNFFKQADGLIITGPTGTNVMDLHIALISD